MSTFEERKLFFLSCFLGLSPFTSVTRMRIKGSEYLNAWPLITTKGLGVRHHILMKCVLTSWPGKSSFRNMWHTEVLPFCSSNSVWRSNCASASSWKVADNRWLVCSETNFCGLLHGVWVSEFTFLSCFCSYPEKEVGETAENLKRS